MMHLLTTLLLAHLFADFPLQSNRLARLKKSSIRGVFIHVLIYMGATAILLQQPLQYWPLVVGLGLAHFTIDAIKIVCTTQRAILSFVIDQIMHVATVVLAVLIAYWLWRPVPQGILSDYLLGLAFSCALLLAIMVFCWVWTNDLSEEQLKRYVLLRWVKNEILLLEQRVGLVLIGIVLLGQFVIK